MTAGALRCVFRSWFAPWVEQRHQLQQLDRGASSASRGVGTRRRTCWSACAHDLPCPCRSARAGRPAPFARPASKQAAVPWSYTRCRRGRSCGAGGSRIPRSPGSGWRAAYPPPLPGPAGRTPICRPPAGPKSGAGRSLPASPGFATLSTRGTGRYTC